MTTHRPMDERDWRPVLPGPGRRTTRALLGCLAAYNAGIGAYAAVAPHAFYRNVVGVDLLGPYNQHLVGDVGGLYLGFALLFAWAALRPGRELVRAACAGFLLTEVIHLAYHLAHLERFSFDQAALETIALAPLLALPVAVLGLTRRTTS